MSLDVGGLALEAPRGLVHHDPRAGQRVALPLGARAQQELAHRRRETHADGAHVGLDEAHGVVDGQSGGHRATRRVDVQPDVPLGVLALEVQELGGDQVGDVVVDLAAEDDDAVLEESVEGVGRGVHHGGGHLGHGRELGR